MNENYSWNKNVESNVVHRVFDERIENVLCKRKFPEIHCTLVWSSTRLTLCCVKIRNGFGKENHLPVSQHLCSIKSSGSWVLLCAKRYVTSCWFSKRVRILCFFIIPNSPITWTIFGLTRNFSFPSNSVVVRPKTVPEEFSCSPTVKRDESLPLNEW